MKYFALLFVLAGTLFGAAFRPQQLRSEYRVNPLGIDATAPRLSWVLNSPDAKARGLHQTAYRVLVAASSTALAANTGDLWDSGKVASAASIHVAYAGKPLTSGAAAFWKVQVWDQAGLPSEWSAPAQWTMGLLKPEDWQGQWIGRDEVGVYKAPDSIYKAFEHAQWIWATDKAQTSAPAGDQYFRSTFTVPAGRKVKHALLIVTSDPNTEFFVNAEKITTVMKTNIPEDAEITASIHPGENQIAVHAPHPKAGTPAGLLAAIKVDFESGEPLLVQSNNTWRAIAKPEAGEAGGNPQAGRRSAKAWHSFGAGSIYPAGGVAGSAKAMGPDVFRTQLWVPAGTVGSSGGGTGAAVYRRRPRLVR